MVEEEFEVEWGFPMDGNIGSTSGHARRTWKTPVDTSNNLMVVNDNAADNVGGAELAVAPMPRRSCR